MLICMRRLIAVVLFFLCSTVVFADTYPAFVTTYYSFMGITGPSQSAVCDAYIASLGSTYRGGGYNYCSTYPNYCVYFRSTQPLSATCNVAYYAGIVPGPINTYSCPGGGTLSGYSCINATACVAPKTRDAMTKLCVPPVCPAPSIWNEAQNACVSPDPTCTSTQQLINHFCVNDPVCSANKHIENHVCVANPLSVCTYPQNPVTDYCKFSSAPGINCASGAIVYPPIACPPGDAKWQSIFSNPIKPMCSPLATDHTNCTPLLFDRLSDWASGHAIQYMMAGLAIATPALFSGFTTLSNLVADYPLMLRNNTGDLVDAKVSVDVPPPAFGQAITDFMKSNPFDSYSSGLSAAANNAAFTANGTNPFEVNPTTHELQFSDTHTALSANQVAQLASQLNPVFPVPLSQVATYLPPENIPWLSAAKDALVNDLQNLASPSYFPNLTTPVQPVQVSSPYLVRTPTPISVATPVPVPAETIVRGLNPFASFTPASPDVYAPPLPTNIPDPAAKSPSQNLNPTGLQNPISVQNPTPDPNTPVDPNLAAPPPLVPDIYPDTYKYFDFLPMLNPFKYTVADYLPSLPTPAGCTYEIHKTFHVPLLGTKHFDLAPCVPLQPLRDILAWAFSVLTLFMCFFIIFRSSF